jgi:hypothetical protein
VVFHAGTARDASGPPRHRGRPRPRRHRDRSGSGRRRERVPTRRSRRSAGRASTTGATSRPTRSARLGGA